MSNWTLSLWVLKCLVELALLYVCVTRRVRIIWLLALYTFTSSLGLMLIFDHLPTLFVTATRWVDITGTLIMCFIFTQLVSYVVEGEAGYCPVLAMFVVLITTQTVCYKLNTIYTSVFFNRLNIILWIVSLFGLILTCRRFPRSIRGILPIDFMSMTIVLPHQSVLIPHDNQSS
jgi:hypothetical protein